MKQRLVGTLVLGSLALIVIPLLLDGQGVERPPLSATIPPAPVFDTTPLPDPERPVLDADSMTLPAATPEAEPDAIAEVIDALPGDASGEPEPTSTIATDTEAGNAPAEQDVAVAEIPAEVAEEEPARSVSTPALDASGLPEGWIVRLGAFGNRANADALVTRLVAAGHKAYIRPVMSGDVALNGVFVGPVPTRNEASTLQAELKSRFQISDAIVQRYDIAQ